MTSIRRPVTKWDFGSYTPDNCRIRCLAGSAGREPEADIEEKGGESAPAKLAENDHKADLIACDVGDALDVRSLVADTVSDHGGVDILINNAAMLGSAPLPDLEEEDFDAVLKSNQKGPFLLGQAVAKQTVKQVDKGRRPGAIVNMSSVNAIYALPDHVAFTVAKVELAQLTKALALSLADKGICVNAIGTDPIMTEMLEKVATDKTVANRIPFRTPLGRFGEPSEVAAIAAFLASDEASDITGTTIYADGGRLSLNCTVDVWNE